MADEPSLSAADERREADSKPLRVCCMGAGYVGGPTMAVIAQNCPWVTAVVVDISEERIAAWNSEELPIYEPGLKEAVLACRGRNLFFSTAVEEEVAAADIVFVSVNTPTKEYGIGAGRASDVKNCEICARTIAAASTSGKIVVEKSTVPVRTAATIREVLAANARGLRFQVLSNPEFLAEGTAMADLRTPDRVLIGGEDTVEGRAAINTLASLYAAWVPRERIIATNLWSSELSKLVANAFLAQRISSINSIAVLCEHTDADVTEVARAVGTDHRLGPHFLRSSVGFGGSCFQKDILNLVYIAESLGLAEVARYWQSVIDMNDYMKRRFAHTMVRTMFNSIAGKRVAIFGFAFKKDTGDTRETAAAYVCRYLLEERAQLSVYDPKVTADELLYRMEVTIGDALPAGWQERITMADAPEDAVAGAHALAVLTEWDEFAAYDYAAIFEAMVKPAFVFDGRNVLDHCALQDIGFSVYAIGRNLHSSGGSGADAGAAAALPAGAPAAVPAGVLAGAAAKEEFV
eukprot:PLAT3094.1.p1 GENE.PLAT3094.1~~PLAT3094.1.p1  ORF type:complete len:529 (-),score=254.55 PLAT3094.1:95-1654(-)